MTQSKNSDPASVGAAKATRRDWLLLPLLGLLTIVAMAASAKLLARQAHLDSWGDVDPCLVFGDVSTGVRGNPGSVCWSKGRESGPVEYRFNSNGYRTDVRLGPKQQGTYRIVMTGASFALGAQVPVEKSSAALLPVELAKRTRRRIELYNEGMFSGSPHSVGLRFKDVLAAQPDLILWELTAWDIKQDSILMPPRVLRQAGAKGSSMAPKPAGLVSAVKAALASASPREAIQNVWDESNTAFALRHFLYEIQSLYVDAYLMPGNKDSDFLRKAPSAAWQTHLQQFDSYAADVELQAQAAGVPLIAVYVPNRAPAAMISRGEWPEGYDPYKLGDDIRAIILKHGGTYIDLLPEFRNLPNPERYYLPIDGHPTTEGQAMIAALLAKALTNGAVPALRVAAQPQTALEQGR
jgi:hypothetical protein